MEISDAHTGTYAHRHEATGVYGTPDRRRRPRQPTIHLVTGLVHLAATIGALAEIAHGLAEWLHLL